MALPTLVKTWQNNCNNQQLALGAALTDARTMLLAIKNALIGFGTQPWTVRYSCSSTVAGSAGDGVDRWAAIANLVWAAAGTAHSWIVLQQTGLASGYQLLISLEAASATGNVVTYVVSPSAGFTGGSTTARPTATDEIVVAAGVQWATSLDVSYRWSVMQSTDGQCTRVLVCGNATQQSFLLIDKLQNPTSGFTNPVVAIFLVTSSFTTGALSSATATVGKTRFGSVNSNVALTSLAIGTAQYVTDTNVGNITNDIDSNWPMLPVAAVGLTSGVRGILGSVFDFWFGSGGRGTADTYPATGNSFAQFGCFILPWDGSTPLLS